MDGDQKVVETKDVEVCEGDGIVPDGMGKENEAIDFDMLNEDIIFDDQNAEKEEGARNEHHSDGVPNDTGSNDV